MEINVPPSVRAAPQRTLHISKISSSPNIDCFFLFPCHASSFLLKKFIYSYVVQRFLLLPIFSSFFLSFVNPFLLILFLLFSSSFLFLFFLSSVITQNRSVLSGIFSTFLSTSTTIQNSTKSEAQYVKNISEKISSNLSVKNVLLIPEKVPVPSVPSLSIIRNTLSSSSNKKEIINDYDNNSGRSSEKNNYNQNNNSNNSNSNGNNSNGNNSNGNNSNGNNSNGNNSNGNNSNGNDSNGNNSNGKINNKIEINNNNNNHSINSINSITSNPSYPIPSIPPLQPSSSPFHDTKESTKLSSFYESKLPSTSTSLSQFFDSKDSRSSNEFSSGDVSRSSSGMIYGNWTEVYDSPGINLNLNLNLSLKKNNSYENNSDFGYENKNEKSDEKLYGEEKERSVVSVKKNGEGGRGGGKEVEGGSEKERESESEKKKERESGKERVVKEEKKAEMSVDNWMETSIDKNYYEKRNKENFYNNLNKNKSNEKEKEKGNSGKYGNSSLTGNVNRVCDIIPKQVVLYYCSVLIAGMPGMIYITQTLLCFSSLTTKECFFLNNLDRVKIIEKNEKKDKKTQNLFSSLLSLPPSSSRYPILFSFFSGAREITVLPLTISSDQLQSVIIEIKNSFHSSYFTE
jgi:hypothetical protein